MFLKGKLIPQEASVAKRMSWVSNRETTKPEDLAYCLPARATDPHPFPDADAPICGTGSPVREITLGTSFLEPICSWHQLSRNWSAYNDVLSATTSRAYLRFHSKDGGSQMSLSSSVRWRSKASSFERSRMFKILLPPLNLCDKPTHGSFAQNAKHIIATISTVTKMTLAQLKRLAYHPRMSNLTPYIVLMHWIVLEKLT
jgi:hypothetical protein